ncbi:hypothetical protein ACVWXN_005854 [Bradyrhizobium sp. i1.4.4]
MNGHAIFENVRRYRGIASLYRQTAAFRPGQSWSLLEPGERVGSAGAVGAGSLFRRARGLRRRPARCLIVNHHRYSYR